MTSGWVVPSFDPFEHGPGQGAPIAGEITLSGGQVTSIGLTGSSAS